MFNENFTPNALGIVTTYVDRFRWNLNFVKPTCCQPHFGCKMSNQPCKN